MYPKRKYTTGGIESNEEDTSFNASHMNIIFPRNDNTRILDMQEME